MCPHELQFKHKIEKSWQYVTIIVYVWIFYKEKVDIKKIKSRGQDKLWLFSVCPFVFSYDE